MKTTTLAFVAFLLLGAGCFLENTGVNSEYSLSDGADDSGDSLVNDPDSEPFDTSVSHDDADVTDGAVAVDSGEEDALADSDFDADIGDADYGDSALCTPSPEVCNDEDDDCDGEVDEDAIDGQTWYLDNDSDGFGIESASVISCEQPLGYSPLYGDCDESDPLQNPDGTEVCNNEDDDCDDAIDNDAVDGNTLYRDRDDDGYGDAEQTIVSCGSPPGFVANNTDCDPDDGSQHPGALENCNAEDDDCDGEIDEDTCTTCQRHTYGSSVYLFCQEALQWAFAQAWCIARGYDLVIIETAAEDGWLWDTASAIVATDWWIGLTDIVLEGSYVWVNGIPAWVSGVALTYCNWRDNPLYNNDGEDCIELDEVAGYWADGGCTQSQPFICEVSSTL